MKFQTTLLKQLKLNFSSKTVVEFDKNLEFSLTPQSSGSNNYIFQLHDFKGNFEISKIYCTADQEIVYDKENKTFVTTNTYKDSPYEFSILTDIEFKKVAHVHAQFRLEFPATRLKRLKQFEFFEESFTLPEYEEMKFKYFIKKVRDGYVVIHIQNPQKIEIYDSAKGSTGKTEDFIFELPSNSNIAINLVFIFDPLANLNTHSLSNQDDETSKNLLKTFYEAFQNTNFADVILFSASGKEIPSYRCILAKYSTFFAKCFDEAKEHPVNLNLKDQSTEIIKAALDFCYGKTDAINGKEAKLFEFANKYSFPELKKACSVYFETKVNPSNVCEIVEIAYANNFEGLKQKCHRILVEHKEKIDSNELKKLSKEILINAFCI